MHRHVDKPQQMYITLPWLRSSRIRLSPDFFSLKRFLTFEQRYSSVAFFKLTDQVTAFIYDQS